MQNGSIRLAPKTKNYWCKYLGVSILITSYYRANTEAERRVQTVTRKNSSKINQCLDLIIMHALQKPPQEKDA
jgi:hypothetical protein